MSAAATDARQRRTQHGIAAGACDAPTRAWPYFVTCAPRREDTHKHAAASPGRCERARRAPAARAGARLEAVARLGRRPRRRLQQLRAQLRHLRLQAPQVVRRRLSRGDAKALSVGNAKQRAARGGRRAARLVFLCALHLLFNLLHALQDALRSARYARVSTQRDNKHAGDGKHAPWLLDVLRGAVRALSVTRARARALHARGEGARNARRDPPAALSAQRATLRPRRVGAVGPRARCWTSTSSARRRAAMWCAVAAAARAAALAQPPRGAHAAHTAHRSRCARRGACRSWCASRSGDASRIRRTWTLSSRSIKPGATVRAPVCERAPAAASRGARDAAAPSPRARASLLRGEHAWRGMRPVRAAADGCALRARARPAVRYKLDQLNKEFNATNKAVAALKKARRALRLRALRRTNPPAGDSRAAPRAPAARHAGGRRRVGGDRQVRRD